MNIVKFTWNLENLTLDDFGLDPEFNMLSAPTCKCGCGGKALVCLEDEDDVYGFLYSILAEQECTYCAAFAITEDNMMLGVIKCDDDYDFIESKERMDDYSRIGEMFYDLELHIYGLIVAIGHGEYKIVEE